MTMPPAPFDWRAYLARYPKKALTTPEGRRAVTKFDPLLFSLLYMRHILSSPETGGQVSFSQFHMEFYERAKQWARKDLRASEIREVWVAPRSSGKSMTAFVICPVWALAHGHRRFVSAFADSATQAEKHLITIKMNLDSNKNLRRDYPELCNPATRPTGAALSDNRGLYIAQSGVKVQAVGIDSAVLGANLGGDRPDLLLFDDVEPSGSNYSLYQKEKRLATIIDAVLPMNDRAVVQVVGTVTMPGSIVHDAVKTVYRPSDEAARWISEEKFVTRAFPAIVTDPETGDESSLWPERWPLEDMQAVASNRTFRLNMMNDPMAADGDYWTFDDFRHGLPDAPLTGQLLSIDPAVTSKGTSDYTGLAVVAYSKPAGVALVRHVRAVKVPPGEELRSLVLRIIDAYPETTGILIESNQGGQVWRAILHHMPIPVKTIHQHEPKEVRAARLLNHYQMGRVLHERSLPVAEEQMISFPKGANDDVVDAIGAGVQVFLGKRKTATASSLSYV